MVGSSVLGFAAVNFPVVRDGSTTTTSGSSSSYQEVLLTPGLTGKGGGMKVSLLGWVGCLLVSW